MEQKRFYITTPLYYPSDKLHIGHTYCTVATDTIARYHRLKGEDVMFLTGTDEHGQKIEQKANEAGVTPQEFVDRIVDGPRGVRDLWKLMNISNDRFIRTTDDYHVKAIQRIFRRMYDNGDIYKGTYKGKYCTPCESFWTESQLKDGCCPDCGRPVVDAEEEAYFFRLSKYADRIRDLLENTDFLQPRSRVNEMVKNFIDPGLEDLCVSRTSFTWGIPVDFDPKHVVYVWVDALSNYITALGYENDRYNDYKKYWPGINIVGKEIVRFHSIIWPAMLMSLGEPVPKHVFGHGWLLLDGGKMSKSKGNVVSPDDLVRDYGCDSLRLYELFVGPPELDSEWDDRGIEGVYRFISRFWKLVMDQKDQDVKETKELIKLRNRLVYDVTTRLENFSLNTVISAFMEYNNKLIELAKKTGGVDKETLKTFTILLAPFAPHIGEEIWQQLGGTDSVFHTQWPECDEEAMKDDEVQIGVQVNGKARGVVTIPADASRDVALAAAKEAVADKISGTIVKEIYVPGKIINIVCK